MGIRVTFPEAPRLGPAATGLPRLVHGTAGGLQRKCQVEETAWDLHVQKHSVVVFLVHFLLMRGLFLAVTQIWGWKECILVFTDCICHSPDLASCSKAWWISGAGAEPLSTHQPLHPCTGSLNEQDRCHPGETSSLMRLRICNSRPSPLPFLLHHAPPQV